jgi:YVTN family beta-propeller protein
MSYEASVMTPRLLGVIAAPSALIMVLATSSFFAGPALATDPPPFTVISQTAYPGFNGTAVAASSTYGFVGKPGEVAVIDSGGRIVQTIAIPGGVSPYYAVVAGDALLLANNIGDSVTVVNAATLTYVRQIATGSTPWFIGVDGGRAFVLDALSNSVTVLDIDKALNNDPSPVVTTLTGGGLSAPASISFVGTTGYVANRSGSALSRIDLSPATPVMDNSITVTPSNNSVSQSTVSNGQVFIGNYGNILVNVFAGASETAVVTPIIYPQALGSCGNEVYVAERILNRVVVIDSTLNPPAVTGLPIPVGDTPHDMGVFGGFVYVLNATGKSVSIIECATRQVIATRTTSGTNPDGIAFNATRAFVASGGFVTVLDIGASSPPPAPPRIPPGPPVNVTASPILTGAIVTWSPPADPGTDNLNLYAVRAWPGGPVCQGPASTLTCTVTGLDPELDYYFTVVPMSGAGWGTASAPSNTIRPLAPEPPGAPTDVVVVPGDAQATVSWVPPSSEGSSPIREYRVVSSPDYRSCVVSAITCTVTGLTNGTAYTFMVQATNDQEWGPESQASAAVTPQAQGISIRGERLRHFAEVFGTTTGIAVGTRLEVWIKLGDSAVFVPGSSSVVVNAYGTFAWFRQVSFQKTLEVYLLVGDAQSNTLYLPRGGAR